MGALYILNLYYKNEIFDMSTIEFDNRVGSDIFSVFTYNASLLKISQYMANRLRDLGADVTLTRNIDETLSPTDRVNRVLNAYGDSKDIVVISNHINAGGERFTYHY